MKNILGVEIGNKTLKLVEVKKGSISNFAVVDLPDNAVINGELIAFEEMSNILREAFRKNRFSCKQCALILPDNDVYLRRMTMPVMNEKQLMVNIPYEFKDVISNDKDKYFYDYSMIRHIKDDEGVVKEMELLGAVVSKELIEKYEEMFKKAGLRLVKAEPRETALGSLANALNSSDEKKDFAILDLGYKSSKVDIFKEGVYEVTRTVDYGVEEIIKVAADIMDIDEHLAASYLEMNKNNIQGHDRCIDIYSSIAIEVMRVMNYYAFENPNSNLDTLYYCGGGANIARFIEEVKTTNSLEIEPLSLLGKDIPEEAIMRASSALGACFE